MTPPQHHEITPLAKTAIAHAVANWYADNARDLPWRRHDTSAWAVLVSEVMSQQTPVARVAPLWRAWLERWPGPADLARADRADVLVMWANLGYPRRALRLQECATAITQRADGAVPRSVAELEALPGIGTYTARAVAAFAFDTPVPVVDTNVRRVLKRLVKGEFLQGTARTRDLTDVGALLPEVAEDPKYKGDAGVATWWKGTGNDAHDTAVLMCAGLMELGAVICTARSPKCEKCPVQQQCRWVQMGRPEPSEEERQAAAERVQKFEGTDRQVRGKIMALLRDPDAREHGLSRSDIDVAWPDQVQLERALDSLLADGLVRMTDARRYRL